jgi:glucose/arabinose dehydrogenase
MSASETRAVLEVKQPYDNHNGGQIAFGEDGYLYIALGDGGDGGDPHRNGQNRNTLLGKILRIDVDRTDGGMQYGIPSDNPFVGDPSARAEIWAYGVRNPWRFSFDRGGRMIVADVGQDRFEELSFAGRGGNLGWRQREADVCFEAPADGSPCDDGLMREPFLAYGREDGQSVTGGLVYEGSAIPELRGKYLFADFVRGKFWALDLPDVSDDRVSPRALLSLGRFSVMPSAFARDVVGELYVADFGRGSVYRIARAKD